MSLPDKDTVDEALKYLAKTDVEYAQLVGLVKKTEHMKHHILAMEKLASREKTAAAKETQAYASNAYKQWIEDSENATVEQETLKAKRHRAGLAIDVWRSLNSARSKGQII